MIQNKHSASRPRRTAASSAAALLTPLMLIAGSAFAADTPASDKGDTVWVGIGRSKPLLSAV